MSGKFTVGQRVRIIGVDDIPYGQKYSFLEATIDKTGVIQEIIPQSARYVIRLDDDGDSVSFSEGCLEKTD